jgi:hypothetical protein
MSDDRDLEWEAEIDLFNEIGSIGEVDDDPLEQVNVKAVKPRLGQAAQNAAIRGGYEDELDNAIANRFGEGW